MSSPQYTNPAALVQFATEDVTYGNDTAAVTTTPTAVTVTLTNAAGTTVTLSDLPAVSGSVISQRVRANVLTRTSSPYFLTFTYTPTGTTNVLESVLVIECPQ